MTERPVGKQAAQGLQPEGDTSRGYELGVTEAAIACGVHRTTIVRKQKAGEFPNSRQDGRGWWLIPVADLEAAGLKPNRSRASEDVQQSPIAATDDAITRLEQELAEARRRASVAEALASERLDRIADMKTALRLLEAGPQRQKRRWWSRRGLSDEG